MSKKINLEDPTFLLNLVRQHRFIPYNLSSKGLSYIDGVITIDINVYNDSYYITSEAWILLTSDISILGSILLHDIPNINSLPLSSLYFFAVSTDKNKYQKIKREGDYRELEFVRKKSFKDLLRLSNTNKNSYYPFKNEELIPGNNTLADCMNKNLAFNPVVLKIVLHILDKDEFWDNKVPSVICNSSILYYFDKQYLPLIFKAVSFVDDNNINVEYWWYKLGLTSESRNTIFFESLIRKIEYYKMRSLPGIPKVMYGITDPEQYLSSYTDSELSYFYEPFSFVVKPKIDSNFNLIIIVISNTKYWSNGWGLLRNRCPNIDIRRSIVFVNFTSLLVSEYQCYNTDTIYDWYFEASTFEKEKFMKFLQNIVKSHNEGLNFKFEISHIKNLITVLKQTF